jgi:hypothetical protein
MSTLERLRTTLAALNLTALDVRDHPRRSRLIDENHLGGAPRIVFPPSSVSKQDTQLNPVAGCSGCRWLKNMIGRAWLKRSSVNCAPQWRRSPVGEGPTYVVVGKTW